MTNLRFYIWLILTAVCSLAIGLFIGSNPESKDMFNVTCGLNTFFIIFTVAIFSFSRQAMSSANPFLFTRMFLVSILVKIVLLSMLVIASIKFLHIPPRDFIIPLLSSYLLFTILETWVLMKLSIKN